MNFYVPQYREELYRLLRRMYPDGKFSHMKRRQLVAIYINTRKKEG